MSQIKGLAVEGSAIKNLQNKEFSILGYEYRTVKDLDNPDKTKEKLVLNIKLAENNAELDYYPNLTSQKTLVAKYGHELDLWVNNTADFKVLTQMVGKDERGVLYIV